MMIELDVCMYDRLYRGSQSIRPRNVPITRLRDGLITRYVSAASLLILSEKAGHDLGGLMDECMLRHLRKL